MHEEFEEEDTDQIDMSTTPPTPGPVGPIPGYDRLGLKEKDFVQKLVREFNKFSHMRHDGEVEPRSYTGSYFAYSRKFLGENYVSVTIEFPEEELCKIRDRASASGLSITKYIKMVCAEGE